MTPPNHGATIFFEVSVATIFGTLRFFRQLPKAGFVAGVRDIETEDNWVCSEFGVNLIAPDQTLLAAAGTKVICFDIAIPQGITTMGTLSNPRLAVQQIGFKKVGVGPRGVVRTMFTAGWLDPNSSAGAALVAYAAANPQYASIILQQ